MHVRVWARTYTLELHGSPKIIAVAMELLQFYYDSYNKVTVFIACIYIYIYPIQLLLGIHASVKLE